MWVFIVTSAMLGIWFCLSPNIHGVWLGRPASTLGTCAIVLFNGVANFSLSVARDRKVAALKRRLRKDGGASAASR